MNDSSILYLKKICLILFVFSLPFEYWDPFGVASFLSVTKMTGFCYAGLSLLTIRHSFDRSIFMYVRILLIFWIWLVLLSMFNYTGANSVSIFNLTIFQNIIIYWLIASDLRRGNIHVKTVMLSFVLSIVMLNVLRVLGVGLSQEYEEGISRITFFGNNSNTVGVMAGLALVFSLYFLLNPDKTYGKKVYLLVMSIPLFVDLLLLSASRGALLTTGLCIVLLFTMNKTIAHKRVLQVGLLLAMGSYFMNKLAESELMSRRLNQFIDEGNTAGRGEIWDNVLGIVYTRPLTGYGTTGFENKMVMIYGFHKDAHNLFLFILVTTGLIGFIVFLFFLFPHITKAIRNLRRGDVAGIIILVFYITTVFKAGGAINNKLMWLLLAIIMGTTIAKTSKEIQVK